MATSRTTISALASPAFALLLSACGGSDEVDQFVGTWMYNSGSTAAVTCPNGGNNTATIVGNDQFSNGVDTDLVVIDPDGCNFKLNVNGNRAEYVPGQSCTVQDPTTGAIKITVNSSAYTLSQDVLSLSSAGSMVVSGANCTFTLTGTLKKIAN
jgi:hypothetical protein